jgi:hypothetical protein
MTATITPRACPTPFDRAFVSAMAAGWPGPMAFTACCCMKAHGMSDGEIEQAFIDAARRIQ